MRTTSLVLLLLVSLTLSAQEKWNNMIDKVMNWPVIGIVLPTYSEETNWNFNGGLQSCFNMPGEATPSAIRVTGYYSLNRQWQIHTTGTLYMAGKIPWMFYYGLRYRHYPTHYYVTDSLNGVHDYPYTTRGFDFTFEPMFRLPNNWAVGPMVDFVWEKNNLRDTCHSYMGPGQTLEWGLGLATMYDTRDYSHYPTKGMMFKGLGIYYEPALGADYRAWRLDAEFRHFVTLWQPAEYKSEFERVNKSLIFAYHIKGIAVLSNQSITDMPIQIMPTIGGDELVRGVRSDWFKDNNLIWAIQGELRFPIFSILRGTVFAGVGDVYNTDHWKWGVPKVGYGLGLRLSVNREHVNVRFDVARNNLDNNWASRDSYSFILAISEAF
ncbi:MAG: outer membrane protein assembly factor [Paludibacteraceae bacterium]|nr:outer membrane protein assembly factor [Paludibacteraceae bacterium]